MASRVRGQARPEQASRERTDHRSQVPEPELVSPVQVWWASLVPQTDQPQEERERLPAASPEATTAARKDRLLQALA